MKTAKEWVNDVREIRKASDILSDYDYFGGELENMSGAFVAGEFEAWQMAGLTDDEMKALECYVESDSKNASAARMGVSVVWFNVLFDRAIAKLDAFIATDRKYNRFKGGFDPDLL